MEEPNLEYIDSISQGDELFKKEIVSIIKEELPMEVLEYRKNLRLKKYNKAAENVHKLKHKINILGLKESYQIATVLEEELKKDNIGLVESFNLTLNNLLKFIKKL